MDESLIGSVLDELGRTLRHVHPAGLDRAADMIAEARAVFLAGAGRSALGIRGFAMRLMHLGRRVYVAGETTTPGIRKDDLLVIGSGSGKTAGLVAMSGKARENGAKILLLTMDPSSPLGIAADHIIEIPAPTPKSGKSAGVSIQPMGTLFEQSLFITCDILVLLLMRKLNLTSEEMFSRHANLE
ncbi:MAG: 6-phospho-3-hexuloisomerase [Spirochaetales bacterium]|nr:MAG: 6-phospho-3-hexuloisomerase [Spirochaetales bacterium]